MVKFMARLAAICGKPTVEWNSSSHSVPLCLTHQTLRRLVPDQSERLKERSATSWLRPCVVDFFLIEKIESLS